VIRDLSTTLQALLSDPTLAAPFPELHQAQIAFDRPDDGFKPARAGGQLLSLRQKPKLAQDQEPEFRQDLTLSENQSSPCSYSYCR
jgi:hypothetical protein